MLAKWYQKTSLSVIVDSFGCDYLKSIDNTTMLPHCSADIEWQNLISQCISQ